MNSMQFETKKSLGQHFLNNPRIPEKMAEAGRISKGDIVVEVGPGTGALTKTLLAYGAKVIALEADKRAIASLEETFEEEIAVGSLQIHHTDIREGIPTELKIVNRGYKVVANIPYYLSGMLFRMFLEAQKQPSDLIFLVQKEIAQRIARDPKESLLSLSVKAYGTPSYICTVSRGNFTPPPKVDSAIIAITDISRNRFAAVDEHFFFEVLHVGFAAKRKQLLGNLASRFDRSALTEIFETLELPLKVRGEDLSVETWMKLVRALRQTQS